MQINNQISLRRNTLNRIILLGIMCFAIGVISLRVAHAQQAENNMAQISGACTPSPSPANNFLFLPFDTSTEGDWLSKMTSAFDHDKPNYECSLKSGPCDDNTRKIILWNGDVAKPIPIYSTQSPYLQIGIECYLPGNTPTLIKCDGVKRILGYQSVTVDMGVAAAFYDGHDGYDWGLNSGNQAKILAAASGIVTKVEDDGAYGRTVTIDHLNGYSTKYSHLNTNNVSVGVNDCVEAGSLVGHQGNSGGDYGIHLHFRVYHGNNLTDPFGYCYECAGSPRDPLLDYNGESSQNLWYGILPRSVGRAPTRQDLGLVWNAFYSNYLGGPGDPVDVLALTPSPPPTATSSAVQNGIEIVGVSNHTVLPGEKFNPSVTIRVVSGYLDPARGDHLHAVPEGQSNTMSAWPVQAVKSYVGFGQTYTFNINNDSGFQMTAPSTPGIYQSVWQMRVGGNHIGPQAIIQINVQGPNHAPPSPVARTPGDWAEIHSQQAPELCWDSVSDQDGDSVQYYAEIYQSAVLDNSGWVSGTCWRPTNISGQYFGYQWHVKAKDNRGAESGFGNTNHFTLSPPLYDPQQPTTIPQSVGVLPVQTGYSWSTAYLYRRPLVISTNDDLKAGMVIKVDGIDLETLVAAGKMRADHNDLRVVRRLSATTWQEVPRNYYSGWDVEFQLLSDIYPGTDTSYYLYYGNPSAGAPPTFSISNGWYVDMYRDKWWESWGGTWEFNQAMDINDVCGLPLDHRSKLNSSFDDSDKFRGRLYVPTTGTWTFSVYTNDGYRLSLDDVEVGRFDGYDGNRWVTIGSTYLKAGWHKMDARDMWVNCGAWKLSMSGPGFGNQIIPANYFQKSWGNVKTGINPSAEELNTSVTNTPTLISTPTRTPTNTPTRTPTRTPTASPTLNSTHVRANNALTGDVEWNLKTTFVPSDPIKWIIAVENTTGNDAQAGLVFVVKNPEGVVITNWQGTVTVSAGNQWWGLSGTIPNVVGTYTFTGSVVYQGVTTTRSTTYVVNAPMQTFTDVSASYWANSFIERLSNAGVTGGCGNGNYCPESVVTRAQMAVFLLRGMHGPSYTPPAVGASTGFTDVPVDHWAAAWIKQLAAEGITGGCGSGNYCPDVTVTRAQMAIFLLRAEHGSVYTPPAATGVFTDVPVGHWADKWIEQLAVEGITGGCGAGVYCPETAVTRAQMAVFLVKTFNLP